jgi:hypothetical protein
MSHARVIVSRIQTASLGLQLLQQWQKRPTAPVCFYLFDILWCDGRDITSKTVVQRRERLEQIVTPGPGIQVGGYIEKHGINLFQLAKEEGLEGIIAKRKKSTYRPGPALPGLAEDQVTTAARTCRVRPHRRKGQSKAFWSVTSGRVSRRQAPLLWALGNRIH